MSKVLQVKPSTVMWLKCYRSSQSESRDQNITGQAKQSCDQSVTGQANQSHVTKVLHVMPSRVIWPKCHKSSQAVSCNQSVTGQAQKSHVTKVHRWSQAVMWPMCSQTMSSMVNYDHAITGNTARQYPTTISTRRSLFRVKCFYQISTNQTNSQNFPVNYNTVRNQAKPYFIKPY